MHLGRDSSVGDAGSAVVGCILFQINVDDVFIFKLMLTVCLFLTSVIKLNSILKLPPLSPRYGPIHSKYRQDKLLYKKRMKEEQAKETVVF